MRGKAMNDRTKAEIRADMNRQNSTIMNPRSSETSVAKAKARLQALKIELSQTRYSI
jgi:hypothetical protein